jgi:4-hydroxybenzoate polyprenyltransferase
MLKEYLSLIRFSHTVFALPFAGLATCWALVMPAPNLNLGAVEIAARVLGIFVCMVAARSSAMAFNRLVDQEIDAKNPRTSGRHLPAGILSRRGVWIFFGTCVAIFMAGTLLFLPNWLPVVFSVPVLVWICGYSYAKRFTSAAHLWLGAALALSPLCAWIAIRGEEVTAAAGDLVVPLMLGAAVLLWVAGFDIIYACQDADFDRSAGLHSLPARLGVAGALRLAAILHLLMWLTLAAIPAAAAELRLGWLYAGALVMVAILLVRQHWIVDASNLSRVNEAFFQLNALISLGLTSVAALDSFV